MKILLILTLLLSYGCSQVTTRPEDEDVSVDAALNHAQSSYLLGCVQAFKTANFSPAFSICKERAFSHRGEIEKILRQVPLPYPVAKPL